MQSEGKANHFLVTRMRTPCLVLPLLCSDLSLFAALFVTNSSVHSSGVGGVQLGWPLQWCNLQLSYIVNLWTCNRFFPFRSSFSHVLPLWLLKSCNSQLRHFETRVVLSFPARCVMTRKICLTDAALSISGYSWNNSTKSSSF